MTTTLSLTTEQKEARRLLAGQMFQRGLGASEVARSLGVARGSANRWKTAFEKGGFDGLKAKRHRGAKPKLNARQRERLVKILMRGPKKSGYANDLWTCRRVAQVIERDLQVKYHPGHVWYLLRSLGWTCQLPEQHAREGDEEEMERWRRRQWPRIKRGASVR
jgi:transposase